MTTDRDPRTRIVLSWLREDAHENAERVLLQALDEVDTTPQRRAPWPAWRVPQMHAFAKLIAAAATVFVIAVVGSRFLPAMPAAGGPATAPPPDPSLIARGDFVIRDWGRVRFEALQERGAAATGNMIVRDGHPQSDPPGFEVEFQCSREAEEDRERQQGADGPPLVLIGGVLVTRASDAWPAGTLAAIALRRESTVAAQLWVGSLLDHPATQTRDCQAYLDAWLAYSRTSLPDGQWLRDDIEGTVEFGP